MHSNVLFIMYGKSLYKNLRADHGLVLLVLHTPKIWYDTKHCIRLRNRHQFLQPGASHGNTMSSFPLLSSFQSYAYTHLFLGHLFIPVLKNTIRQVRYSEN